MITGIGGGIHKVFILQQSQQGEGTVSALHPPQYDDFNKTFQSQQIPPLLQDIISFFDDKSPILQITCGKDNALVLLQDGKIYSYGRGEYGVLGLGGVLIQNVPKQISKLDNFHVSQMACGQYHSLIVTSSGDVFSWGRGFQGQLGLGPNVTCSSSPCYIKHFQQFGKIDQIRRLIKNPIRKIACGAYNSLAIDRNGKLFSWGEARTGQTGTGRKIMQNLPTQIKFQKKIKMARAGFGHGVCLTQDGQVWSWGNNIKGQLGLGDSIQQSKLQKLNMIKAIYYPKLIFKDSHNNDLPKMVQVECGFTSSYAIDQKGQVWAWGGGNLGFKNIFTSRSPKRIIENTQNRIFTQIYANHNTVAMFAPMRTTGLKPKSGPSSGGTQITILGTGFIDTGRQIARFTIGQLVQQVNLDYDHYSDSFYCKSPSFEYDLEYPCQCKVEVSLGYNTFCQCKDRFLIYSSTIRMLSVAPNCASIQGGTALSLVMPLNPLTANQFKYVTVGIQSRKEQNKEKDLTWLCVQGEYNDGHINVILPQIKPQLGNNLIIDVSLNGQQFTGKPSSFHVYDIKNAVLVPNEGLSTGGYQIKIKAEGMFDVYKKQIKMRVEVNKPDQQLKGVRMIQPLWDGKQYSYVVPPASWLLQDSQPTPQLIQLIKEANVQVFLTLNGLEWISCGQFKYVDPQPPKEEEEEVDKKKKDSKKDTKKKGK